MGPHRAHEFQKLVRNYLFFWTLAGINHPLGGWCQLRASVTQRGYFQHRLTQALLALSASLSSSSPSRHCLSHFLLERGCHLGKPRLSRMSSVPFLQRNTVHHMISHHLTGFRSRTRHCLCLLSHSVLPGALIHCHTSCQSTAEDHIEPSHSSA